MGQVLSTTIPVPTEGIVTDVALDVMSPGQAIMLENCRFERGVLKRRPAIEQKIANTGIISALLTYNKVDGTQELLGYLGTALYRLTTVVTFIPGTATVANSFLSSCHARTLAGGTLLFVCDGVNRVGVYNGTNFNNAGFTIGGAADSGLEVVTNYKNRLFFSKKNTCEIYYANTVTAITGVLDTYEVGFYFQRGGRILWIGTWSGNAGNGLDDYLLVVSDQGEALMFSGTDPASATTWSMVGRFFLPKSTSHLNFVQKEADILILTQDGIYAMSSIISLGQGETLVGLTDPIRSFYKQLYQTNQILHQKLTYAPQLQSLFYPIYSTDTILPSINGSNRFVGFLVLNLLNNSWSIYTWGINLDSIYCPAVEFDNTLYFQNANLGTGNYDLMYFDNPSTTTSDYYSSGDIKMAVQLPFNYLEDRQHIKRFISASPYLTLASGASPYDTAGACSIMCNNKMLSNSDLITDLATTTFQTSVDGPNIAWLTAWGKSFSLYFLFSQTTATTAISAVNIIYEIGGYE